MASETVTIELPESVYRSARRIAEATHQPLDAVLRASISQILPPLDDLPDGEAEALAALALLDDGALWRAARATLSRATQEELRELLDLRSEGTISGLQSMRLNQLLDEYGQATVRKAHAYLLLARRGYRVPDPGNP